MEFVLQVDLIVAAVSLFTIIVLWILNVPIPNALILIFIISILLMIITLLILRFLDSGKREES